MGFDLDVLARISGPRLTFRVVPEALFQRDGRRFAPSQGQARPSVVGDFT